MKQNKLIKDKPVVFKPVTKGYSIKKVSLINIIKEGVITAIIICAAIYLGSFLAN